MKFLDWATTRFVAGAAFSIIPFVVQSNLFIGNIGVSEMATLGFWFVGLLVITAYSRLVSSSGSWVIFFPVVLGFASGYMGRTIVKLMEFPIPLDIYLRSFVGPIMFSSLASATGLAIGFAIRKGKKDSPRSSRQAMGTRK